MKFQYFYPKKFKKHVTLVLSKIYEQYKHIILCFSFSKSSPIKGLAHINSVATVSDETGLFDCDLNRH